MNKEIGKQVWVFPDAELPPPGEFSLAGHESLIVLNTGEEAANFTLTLYFEDHPPEQIGPLAVEAQRVRCFRLDRPEELNGYQIPLQTQYAIRLDCDRPVVAQYGRLDTRDQPMAFYTTSGYAI